MSDQDLTHVLERLSRLEELVDEIHVAVVRDEDEIDPAKAYSAKELAELFGCTRQAIYQAMDSGKLQQIPMGSMRKRSARGRDVIAWRRDLAPGSTGH